MKFRSLFIFYLHIYDFFLTFAVFFAIFFMYILIFRHFSTWKLLFWGGERNGNNDDTLYMYIENYVCNKHCDDSNQKARSQKCFYNIKIMTNLHTFVHYYTVWQEFKTNWGEFYNILFSNWEFSLDGKCWLSDVISGKQYNWKLKPKFLNNFRI